MQPSAAEAQRVQHGWRRGRTIGLGAAGAVLAIALMVGSAAAAPATSSADTKYVAPYTGTAGGVVGLGHQGCRTTAVASVLPFFNLTTGVGKESAKVTAASCGSANSTVALDMIVDFLSPEFSTTTGAHNLTATWTLHFTEALVATPGSTKQHALAFVLVGAASIITDLTNGTDFLSSNAPQIEKEISTGSYSHTYTGLKGVSWVDATLKKSHVYEFSVEIEVDLEVSVTSGTTSASASVNMGSGAYHATLDSVTFK